MSRPPETRRRSSRFRSALEEALGVRFEGERGDAFFRSTLVQTLFYGIFSGWVLWSRQTPAPSGPFNWHDASWHLRVPVLESLFGQISIAGRLRSLDLVEVLDWTSAALNRVDRKTFFERFDDGQAVQYFYEPFLEAFDPELRKQLGVWYTPSEVVRYMVARVDMALRDDLGIEDGLAAENVYVLDPCCGTGAYVSEVLRRIAQNLQERVGGCVGWSSGEARPPPSGCSGSRSCPLRSSSLTCRSGSPCRTSTRRCPRTGQSEPGYS